MKLTKEDKQLAEEEFSALVREIRLERGLTQKEVADALQISSSQVSQLENAVLTYKSKVIKRMLDDDFFTDYEQQFLQAKYSNMHPGDSPVEQMRDEFRIKNVPGFYEALEALGDLSELDEDDADLEALRAMIGQDKDNRIRRGGY